MEVRAPFETRLAFWEKANRIPAPQAVARPAPFWKRALDLSCILLSAPLWLTVMLIVSAWIKLTSSGPVFFRQARIGWRGETLTILKFRSMKPDIETGSHERHMQRLIADDCPMTKLDLAGDPRLIPGGRLLRATGLDELPQIFNVWRGEMSLVGPRPATAYELERYEPWQRERFVVAPGLTGLWQVNGKNKTTFREMIHLDLYYARHRSLALDLSILLKTFPALLAQVVESQQARACRRLSRHWARS